jgi:anaerobic magnesium-protoporphyrin IX monomethyl ester cyclase
MRTLLTTLHSKYIHASLALPSLAAYCGKDCGELLIREYTVHEPKESLLALIFACEPDVVAFSVYLWNRIATLELVACLKLVNPELKIILGGAEISFENEDFFNRYPVDALISGEGEMPLRHLLSTWRAGRVPESMPGLRTPFSAGPNGQSLLDPLDRLPSPFTANLVDLSRGLVYFESSRGCPYDCSFCMSALDDRVRSFSMERIFADLQLLIDAGVPQIKFVDRTFNYQNQRSREIFSYLLQHNRSSHFHFEIGAHLLEDETLTLLEQVPAGMFQFEIGVQSTLPETLENIGRRVSLERLAENVRRLRKKGNIHLHLDLIAGLPGDSYQQFLHSLDWTARLKPHHLQLEPVKLLPGAPLRSQAAELGLHFDPSPPYSILRSADLSYLELVQLRGIGRLLDLVVNSGRFDFLLPLLVKKFQGLSACLEDIDHYWRERNLYTNNKQLRQLYLLMFDYLQQSISAAEIAPHRDAIARDYAHHERVVSGSQPQFFSVALTETEQELVRRTVKREIDRLERSGKVQYFAAPFNALSDHSGRTVLIFLYQTKVGKGQQVKEIALRAG